MRLGGEDGGVRMGKKGREDVEGGDINVVNGKGLPWGGLDEECTVGEKVGEVICIQKEVRYVYVGMCVCYCSAI